MKKTSQNKTAKPTAPKAAKVTTNRNDESFGGKAKVDMDKTMVIAKPTLANGEQEASDKAIGLDTLRGMATGGNAAAAAALVVSGSLAFIESEDELTCTESSLAWNRKPENIVKQIDLRGPTNILARFDYNPTQCATVTGKAIPFSILQCSDTGAIVGKPFAASYGLLNNTGFLGVIESILAKLDKLGLKWEIVTTGTLMNRERQFLSVRILEDSLTTLNVDGREFKQMLNCLNSIPSNSGCTVTFANNSFCVCCRNTFAHVLHNEDGAKFHAALKHTRGLGAALKDIEKLIECYFASNKALFANLKSFQVFPVSLEQAEQYFAAFIGRDAKDNLTDKTELSTRAANIVETLKGLFVNGKGNKGQTALDVFQAATEYYTHLSSGDSDNVFKQFASSEIGDGSKAKSSFYSWLVRDLQAKGNFQGVARVGDTLLVNYRSKAAKK